MTVARPVVETERKRPLALLYVYTWDMGRALFALLAAMASFAGAIETNGHTVTVPTYAQVILALSNVSLAASLIIVGAVLTRHYRWVRDVQLWSLYILLVLIIASVAVERITDLPSLIGAAVMIVLDVVAIIAMLTGPVKRWYVEPGRVPLYVSSCVAFWAAISATVVLYMAIGTR